MSKVFVILTLTTLTSNVLANSSDANLESLQKYYSTISRLEATVDQEKTSAFLVRPLKSRAQFLYTPETVTWQILEPVKTRIYFDSKNIKIFSDENPSGELVPTAEGTKLYYVIQFIRSLLTFNLKNLKTDFDFIKKDRSFIAIPRVGSKLSFIKKVTIGFQENNLPQQVIVEAENETTSITFKKFEKIEYLKSGKR